MDHLIHAGAHPEEVADIQARLRGFGLTIDDEPGHFGPSTERAVREFQQRRFLLVDGIVGPQTWQTLVEASWRLGDRILYLKRPYMRGDDVADLQERLNALGFDAGRPDGIFGPLAYAAVRSLQKEYGIPEDGIYGQKTHAALMGLRVDRPGIPARIREQLRHRHGRGLQGELVMIDPGHGGGDLGSIGPSGLAEADVCWRLATLITERVASFGAKARLSRQEPEDPDDTERARRANEMGADLVVSLHLNSNEEPRAEGSSCYHYASSRVGEELAESIQTRLVTRTTCRDCRIHPRRYTILRETRAPAVIVEPAFITNPDEEKKLADHNHLVVIADAIVVGLRDFVSVPTA